MIDLKYFANIKSIRQERKILEDLLEKFFKKQAPMGYPSFVVLSEKIQSNNQTPEAISVYNDLLEIKNRRELPGPLVVRTWCFYCHGEDQPSLEN